MSENYDDPKDIWSGVEALLERWLDERRKLLVQYTEIATTSESLTELETIKTSLQRLREILVDYISAGHFEVFQQLIKEAEAFADGSAEFAKNVIPKIQDTTELALDFHDRYAEPESGDPQQFIKDLSNLGEVLSTRFELEDQLINKLHQSHQK
jgi:regulator of sigma D